MQTGIPGLGSLSQLIHFLCREHMNVVFIGHVDAGKSTTCGQILLLTVRSCLAIDFEAASWLLLAK